jgi:hypothetical protein
LVVAGLIGLFRMDPQKTRERLHQVVGVAAPRVS